VVFVGGDGDQTVFYCKVKELFAGVGVEMLSHLKSIPINFHNSQHGAVVQ
jgi:hypothetical protein